MSRKNYTEKEKRELLSIVDKYKATIENKSTNAITVEQKNAAWDKIAQEYNASAENPRTAKQLNTAYQNLKRLTRQKTADENKQIYMDKKVQIVLKQFKKDKAEDKKAIMATGGGTHTPLLSEVGAQMIALMGDQLKPLSNNCDSATEYFKQDSTDSHETLIAAEPPLEETYVSSEEDDLQKILPKQKDAEEKKTSSSRNKIYLKQKKKNDSTTTIKRMYYKKKLECALLEKKTNLVNYKISLKKEKLVDLEIKIKEFELNSKTK